jgi:hypothetical protein
LGKATKQLSIKVADFFKNCIGESQ